jgi:D-glycero-alpha-D-manno-heptose-7-phosphate kinase
MSKPVQVINAMAPIRICDLGGWTDTWFADCGAVLNIGVYPYAEAQIFVSENGNSDRPRIRICAENFGDTYEVVPGEITYARHPMLEASINIMRLPHNLSFDINLYCAAPAGASTGTSAATNVALLGALDLLTPGQRTVHEIASLAHRVETEELKLQCGIQDQLCAAYGGICFIEMYKYPFASVSQLALPNDIWWELERRLVLVFLGRSHSSSEVHKQVITGLERPDADKSVLETLRQCAFRGKDALSTGDFRAFGESMVANTEAQAALHPSLVSDDARRIIALAQQHGCVGWKVNGAGGEGGSVTVLCDEAGEHKRAFLESLQGLDSRFQVIPTYLARMGLRRWRVSV